jgi:Sec-independent protein translocase protein TatA
MVRQSNVRSAATAKLQPLLTDDLQRQIKGDPELVKYVGELMRGMKSADVTAVAYQLAKGKQNEANALIGEANAARAQGLPDLARRAAQAGAGHRRRRGELQAKQDRAHHHDSR